MGMYEHPLGCNCSYCNPSWWDEHGKGCGCIVMLFALLWILVCNADAISNWFWNIITALGSINLCLC